MLIYRYKRRVWLAINGNDGIKSSEEILLANKKKLLEYEVPRSLPKEPTPSGQATENRQDFASLLGPIPFKKPLLQKAGVQHNAEAESKVIMCPRCKCPNESAATLCVKCKSVLPLQDAVSISTVQKKLVEQNKTIEKMQGQIDMMMQGLMEKDQQYFELKRPLLKTLAREQEKQRFETKNELRIGE